MELRTNILVKRIKESYFLPKHELKKILIQTLEENLNLIEENNNFKNDYLATENQILTEEVNKLKGLCSKLTQENSAMDKHIKELEFDLEDYYKVQDKLLDKYEDSYNERMMLAALEKTTEERNIYKETINKICEQHEIGYNEVFDIIDDIKNEKNKSNERTIK